MKKPISPLNQNVHRQLLDILSAEPSTAQLNLALRLLAKWRAHLIENTTVQKTGRTIKHGPFTGMHYGVNASEGGGVPRLIGAYEASLAPIIDAIVLNAPDLIIDVGCAEGYYAVGLARRLPKATIWARDTDPKAQERCAALAKMNAVEDQIEIGGTMTHADFEICARHRSVVICDTEGAEAQILDPKAAPGLYAADILVECHPFAQADIVEVIQARFEATHDITRIDRLLDEAALPKWLDNAPDLDRLLALWEWRSSPTPWLWMTARPAKQ